MENESDEGTSIVSFINSDDGGHHCGYCDQDKTSCTDGMWAYTMTCQDYQDLIDRGWRRSGQYIYKFRMQKTCCPAYTIRCDALEFKATKSQKKVMKTMTKYLTKGLDKSAAETADEKQESGQSQAAAGLSVKSGEQRRPPRKGEGADPDKPPCRKAKVMRQMRREEKQAAQLPSADQSASSTMPSSKSVGAAQAAGDGSKTIEEFMVDSLLDKAPVHKLSLRLVVSDSEDQDFKATEAESFALYKKYQERVHHDDPDDCGKTQHEKRHGGPPNGYGSFHQQYYIDGKLVAVGVMDILPNCLSSVYVYYDPDLPQLSLGTYTALREILITRQLHACTPAIRWYYMGFYIHTCPKMKYKGNFQPSFLVCPERYTWIPIEQCVPKLEASRYSRLDSSEPPPESKQDIDTAIGKVPIFTSPSSPPMLYMIARSILPRQRRDRGSHDNLVKKYVELAGTASSSMVLVLQ